MDQGATLRHFAKTVLNLSSGLLLARLSIPRSRNVGYIDFLLSLGDPPGGRTSVVHRNSTPRVTFTPLGGVGVIFYAVELVGHIRFTILAPPTVIDRFIGANFMACFFTNTIIGVLLVAHRVVYTVIPLKAERILNPTVLKETRMRDRPVISIENYTIYCGDADENKVGGCAIAMRNDYKNLMEEFGSTSSRCAFVRLRYRRGRKL
ncbi:hypothetical protein RB195_013035 [Necator americanus]|uniref:Uncharacterized protein n=1 Tax=Necator americanus TaxID=51031 RepID=A0ABR1DTQ7_NECAM